MSFKLKYVFKVSHILDKNIDVEKNYGRRVSGIW